MDHISYTNLTINIISKEGCLTWFQMFGTRKQVFHKMLQSTKDREMTYESRYKIVRKDGRLFMVYVGSRFATIYTDIHCIYAYTPASIIAGVERQDYYYDKSKRDSLLKYEGITVI